MKNYPLNPDITIQKLFDKDQFKVILDYNLKNLKLWKETYPNHEDWIRKVIKRFIDDSYNRVAFGGFYHDKDARKNVLCCAVILKKNPYTPYLEIKNLIVFNHPKGGTLEDYKDYYQRQLITHIKKFAEQRGYSRLATELSIKNKDTRDLIKIFLEEEFIIAGRQINRYGKQDEIYFLTTEINEVYGYDPYDNESASKWILSKYLKSNQPEKVIDAIEIVGNRQTLKKDAYIFYSGRKYDDLTKSKFNSKNCLLIIEEYFKGIAELNQVIQIKQTDNSLSNFFIFDFSKENLLTRNSNIFNAKIFDRDELEDLMYCEKEKETEKARNKLDRFPYDERGGLLLISNPDRFPFAKAKKIIKEGKSAIYIKLGALGRYIELGDDIENDMPLAFAYYPRNSDRSKLEIWGIAKLSTNAIPINLDELRENRTIETTINNEESDRDLLFENSDGDLLFKNLEESEDCRNNRNIEVDSILWNKDEFDKHNAYNATKRVVCFQISSFTFLDKNCTFNNVEDILDEKDYLDDIENVFDFYLSKNEVKRLKSRLEEDQSVMQELNNEIMEPPIKILFLAASPKNEVRLQCDLEHDTITEQILLGANRELFEFLHPQLAVTIDWLIRAMNKNPTIIHFSGHGNNEGIALADNNNNSKILTLQTMKRIFKPQQNTVKCIVMNSCYSAEQAKTLSEFGMYIIGNNSPIGDDAAISFARGLYNGLGEGKKITEAVNIGLAFVEHEHPDYANVIEVWKNGVKIEV